MTHYKGIIVCEIIGGLGNQMFQFASSYGISRSNNLNLSLNTNKFKKYKLHNGFELDKFNNLNFKISNNYLSNFIFFLNNLKLIKNILILLKFPQIKFENNFFYNIYLLKNKNYYFSGYFQSYKYFELYEKDIKHFFKFKENLQISKIFDSNSCSIHIRRKDYLNSKVHNVLDINYYKKSIEYILNCNPNSKFFIFTDDETWVDFNFLKNINYELNPLNKFNLSSIMDMYAMSLCKNNIIANSTFSWWAAWLNNNEDKIIISPRKWFQNGSINYKINDIVPESWVLIENE